MPCAKFPDKLSQPRYIKHIAIHAADLCVFVCYAKQIEAFRKYCRKLEALYIGQNVRGCM